MFGKFVTGKLYRVLGKGKMVITSVGLAAGLLAAMACQTPVQTVEVEVTREIPGTRLYEVTREVPVTREVEVTRQVEISRNVEVTREVPVTREIEVTRQVDVSRNVEVTREVPVTRVVEVTRVATATPPPFTPTPRPRPTVVPTPRPTATAVPPQSDWTKLSVLTDRLTDEKSISFATNAISDNQESFYSAPTLYVRCNENRSSEVFIHWGGSYMAGDYPNDDFESQVRFDVGQVREIIWDESTTNEATFVRDAQSFINSMKQSDVAFVRLWDFSDEFYDAEFKIRGLADQMATEPLLCRS